MFCAAMLSPTIPLNCSDVTLGLTFTSPPPPPPPPPQPATNDNSTSSPRAAARRLNIERSLRCVGCGGMAAALVLLAWPQQPHLASLDRSAPVLRTGVP